MAKFDRHQRAQCAHCVGLRIQGQGGCVAGGAVPVGVVCFFFEQMSGVGQQQMAQVLRRGRAVDFAAEAVPHQQRQIAAVVQVGVGQHDGVQCRRIKGQGFPVLHAQRFVALEQAAVQEEAETLCGDEVPGAGNGSCGAEKLDVHDPAG